MRRAAALGLALLLGTVLHSCRCSRGSAISASPSPVAFQRGVSLGLFSEDPLFSYRGLLGEIAALGASQVELVVAYYQRDAASTAIAAHPRFTAPDDTLVTAIRDAHALGLKVMVFPIVRLSDPRSSEEWRGTLRPADPVAWWRSYGALMGRLARLCAREGAFALSVGSELSTLDTDPRPWQGLIASIRRQYAGLLTYSGNWDHYDRVGIYQLVDVAGICGYFSLVDRGKTPPHPVEELVAGWRRQRDELERFSRRIGRPILFTEVGYMSQEGAAAAPWDEGAQRPVDLEGQRRCFAAFARVWAEPGPLAGVYFWNWYGWGGPASIGYTPRNKPAADEIRRYFAGFTRSGAGRTAPPPAPARPAE